ncbi:hypothetical protein [Streptomyces sp. NPDC054838]
MQQPTALYVHAVSVLEEAGIPVAEMAEDDEEMPIITRSGYMITDCSKRFVRVAVFGRSDLAESARQAERDGITQLTRAALDTAGFEVKINEYGHIHARIREQARKN